MLILIFKCTFRTSFYSKCISNFTIPVLADIHLDWPHVSLAIAIVLKCSFYRSSQGPAPWPQESVGGRWKLWGLWVSLIPSWSTQRNRRKAQFSTTSVLRQLDSSRPSPILTVFWFTLFLPSAAFFFNHHNYHHLTYYLVYLSVCLLKYELHEGRSFCHLCSLLYF